MKKQITHSIGRKVFTFFAASLMVMSAPFVQAQATPETKVANNAEITFKGVQNNYLVFKLNYDNKPEQSFELQIKNEDGQLLYAKRYSGPVLNTDIYFAEMPDDCKLTFSIISGKEEKSQTFLVNSSIRTIRDYAVKGI